MQLDNFRILLVDNDRDHRVLFRSALKAGGLDLDLFEVTDGFSAICYLLGNEPYSDRTKFPMPDLIFLDWDIPDMDGFGVLRVIRANLGFQNLPIVVLAKSGSEGDRAMAYSLGATSFHEKPARPRDFVTLLKNIIGIWHPGDLTPTGRKIAWV